jgi:sugar phosphate isomerase/epimerase
MREQAVRIAAMSLGWVNPNGERFVPWLHEVKSAAYDGIAGFSDSGLQEFLARPAELKQLLDAEGLPLASVDVMIKLDDLDYYRRRAEFLAQAGCGVMVCLCGPTEKSDDMFKRLGEHLNHVGEIALSFGVKAVYHNHTGNTGETFEDMDKDL